MASVPPLRQSKLAYGWRAICSEVVSTSELRAAMTTDLRIIDISGIDRGAAATAAVARQVGEAARSVGFFYVTGHGISPPCMTRVFHEAARFFALEESAKARISIAKSRHNRGYVGLRGESLDPKRAPDLKEAFNIGLDLAENDPRVLAGEPFRGVNLWPALPSWRETMLAYFDAVWLVGCRLHRAIAIDLGVDADFFADKIDQPMAILRLLHYPPQTPTEGAGIGAGEHTDYGNLTLLLTDSVGGLEVRRRDGTWIAAPPIADAFICNIGDCLMRWTNDVYVSTPHRVVNRAGRDRYSVAFFLDPNPDAIVRSLPSCVSAERPARYPPITAADYLSDRLDKTYAFRRNNAATAAGT
jgi:isopenicillin N synthase-like dioxygenase